MKVYNLDVVANSTVSGSLNILPFNTNGSYNGITTYYTSSQTISFGQLVFIDSSSLSKLSTASGSAGATSSLFAPAIGISVEPVTINNQGRFLISGIISSGSWSWTVGRKLYLSKTSGQMTQSVAGYTSGDTVQVIGVALSSNKIFFNPSYDTLIIT